MKSIQVLLSTYNGARYLREQLDSLLSQENVDIKILVRDDGSTDDTIKILNEYQNRGLLAWYTGPNMRPAKSFLNLLIQSPESEVYAFCDQDDVWKPEKMYKAICQLKTVSTDIPALYFSEKIYVDSELNEMSRFVSDEYSFTFAESLIDCNCTGCTMAINNELRKLIITHIPDYIEMHDSWIYRVCLGCGGKIIHDDNAYILYRQHSNNVIGINNSKRVRFLRIFDMICGKKGGERYKTCVELNKCHLPLLKENAAIVNLIVNYRSSLLSKLKLIFGNHLKGKSLLSDIKLKINILLNKY